MGQIIKLTKLADNKKPIKLLNKIDDDKFSIDEEDLQNSTSASPSGTSNKDPFKENNNLNEDKLEETIEKILREKYKEKIDLLFDDLAEKVIREEIKNIEEKILNLNIPK